MLWKEFTTEFSSNEIVNILYVIENHWDNITNSNLTTTCLYSSNEAVFFIQLCLPFYVQILAPPLLIIKKKTFHSSPSVIPLYTLILCYTIKFDGWDFFCQAPTNWFVPTKENKNPIGRHVRSVHAKGESPMDLMLSLCPSQN